MVSLAGEPWRYAGCFKRKQKASGRSVWGDVVIGLMRVCGWWVLIVISTATVWMWHGPPAFHHATGAAYRDHRVLWASTKSHDSPQPDLDSHIPGVCLCACTCVCMCALLFGGLYSECTLIDHNFLFPG